MGSVQSSDMDEKQNRYKPIKSLAQGLAVLQYLTSYGPSSAVVVSKGVSVHRTTVKRALETLRDEGYVWFEDETKKYHITDMVLTFIDSSRSANPVIRAFSEIEHDIAKDIPWPVDLTLFSEGYMVVKNSTHRLSPFSFHKRIIGRKLPCTKSAAGRAYLSFASTSVRRDILSMICDICASEKTYIESPQFDKVLTLTQERGWASNDGEVSEESRFSAIAVPILVDNVAYGSLGAIFLRKSMTVDQAASEYLGKLQHLTAEISRRSQ